MRRAYIFALVRLLTALLATTAEASDTSWFWEKTVDSGNKLLTVCTQAVAEQNGADLTTDVISGASVCYAYLQGFRGGYDARLAAEKTGHDFCAANLPMTQLARVLVKTLQDSPQYLHGNSQTLMLGTMLRNFPCLPSVKK